MLAIRPILRTDHMTIPIVEMIETIKMIEMVKMIEPIETIERIDYDDAVTVTEPQPLSEPRAKALPETAPEAERIVEEAVIAEAPVAKSTERPPERAPKGLPMEGLHDHPALIALSEDQGLSLRDSTEAQDRKPCQNA